MNIKVKNILHHAVDVTDHIICKGKLKLIKVTELGSSLFNTINLGLAKEYFRPIIISETEEIEDDDDILVNRANNIEDKPLYVIEKHTRTKQMFGAGLIAYKILAMPEHFSSKILKEIGDGKLKGDDEVYVECEIQNYDYHWVKTDIERDFCYSTFNIKILNNNHIKLFPVNNEIGWGYIKRHCFSTKGIPYSSVIFDWLENNYHPATPITEEQKLYTQTECIEKIAKFSATKDSLTKTYTEEEVISLFSDFNIDVNRTSGGLGFGPASFTRWINQHLKTRRGEGAINNVRGWDKLSWGEILPSFEEIQNWKLQDWCTFLDDLKRKNNPPTPRHENNS